MPASGVAVREVPLESGHGTADYLLYVDGKVVGVVEAKPAGFTLTGVEVQSEKYSTGLPDGLPAPIRPLPFVYESTGVETQFTNGLDPEPRSRPVFSFHTPKTLAKWIESPGTSGVDRGTIADQPDTYAAPSTLRQMLKVMPPLNAPLDCGRFRSGRSRTLRSLWPRADRGRWCRWPQAAARPSWPATRYTG